MEELVREVFEELIAGADKNKLNFKVSNLPPCKGDTTLMRQVWINLLSNAIKYSSKREHAEISIGYEIIKDEISYSIKDNGVGFEMQYVNKLFGVFQRLHSAKDFEGTGVGLAIVQRIIQRHLGRVWAEGEVGKGATFYFTIPIKPEIS
jgi:light-regulated signal transduction histidine kinase (bacteriophytochrome)